MLDLLVSVPYALFTASIAGLAILGALELILLVLVGGGLSSQVDSVFDNVSFSDSFPMEWLLVKDLPLSVHLAMFLAGFGVSGVLIQQGATATIGAPVSLYIAFPVAILLTAIFVSKVGALAVPLFKLQSEAVSEESLMGRTGVLLSPVAKCDYAGELKVVDKFGHTHYLMVEPLSNKDCYQEGDSLRLVGRKGALFIAEKI